MKLPSHTANGFSRRGSFQLLKGIAPLTRSHALGFGSANGTAPVGRPHLIILILLFFFYASQFVDARELLAEKHVSLCSHALFTTRSEKKCGLLLAHRSLVIICNVVSVVIWYNAMRFDDGGHLITMFGYHTRPKTKQSRLGCIARKGIPSCAWVGVAG